MSNIRIKHTHNLDREEARNRVEKLAKDLKTKLDTEYSWKGDCLHLRRSGASGQIDVGDDFVECTVKLGMLLSPMKGRIEATLQENVASLFDDDSDSKIA